MLMTQDQWFWDKIADRYAKKPVPNEAVYQKKLKVTREYLRPEMEVLEFGCGTGSTAIAHAPFVRHILATDISSKMLDIARKKAFTAGVENIDFQHVTIEDLDVPSESIDAVLGLSILHLLDDKESALAKVHEMLRPGGAFVSSTACIGDTMKWFKLVGPVGHFFGLIPKVQVFRKDELVQSIQDAGFEIDHLWRPGKGEAVFIVARKPAE